MSTRQELIEEYLRAAGCGNVKQAHDFLAQGMEVDATNHVGYTALMAAARSYRVEMVRLLLEAGADPTKTFEQGNSVLHCAIGETPSQPEKQAECVRILLQYGASPDVENELGITPLMNAAWFGCTLIVEELLKAGVDVARMDSLSRTAESIANQRGHDEIAAVLAARR